MFIYKETQIYCDVECTFSTVCDYKEFLNFGVGCFGLCH